MQCHRQVFHFASNSGINEIPFTVARAAKIKTKAGDAFACKRVSCLDENVARSVMITTWSTMNHDHQRLTALVRASKYTKKLLTRAFELNLVFSHRTNCAP